ncbi:hypothetical protein ACMFMG_002641 [Clarireedia jacksonii]
MALRYGVNSVGPMPVILLTTSPQDTENEPLHAGNRTHDIALAGSLDEAQVGKNGVGKIHPSYVDPDATESEPDSDEESTPNDAWSQNPLKDGASKTTSCPKKTSRNSKKTSNAQEATAKKSRTHRVRKASSVVGIRRSPRLSGSTTRLNEAQNTTTESNNQNVQKRFTIIYRDINHPKYRASLPRTPPML